MDYDYLVFIGRFQPPHAGHFKIIKEALSRSKRVIVCVGSANSGRTLRNPFTAMERVRMLQTDAELAKACFDDERLHFLFIDDHTYADQNWIKQIQEAVGAFTVPGDKIGLIGCAKDNSSYYLKLFPQWDNIGVKVMGDLNSTAIREVLFNPTSVLKNGTLAELGVPTRVEEAVAAFQGTSEFATLQDEFKFVKKYKAMWADTPYPVIFNTVDTVVIQSGHILLVKRGAMPGKGLWALPGGYINPDENLEQSALRELKEETKIQVDDWTLRECIKKSETFADPHRSPRGRVITHAFLVRLPDKARLPKVKGSDDAVKAKWVPLADINAKDMFEDHYFIIKKMTAGL